MLKITDLSTEKALDHSEMAGITGGSSEFERFTALLDFSTSLMNKVADVNQQFGFSIAQGNSGAVTNNQTIIGGNGLIYAPVHQSQSQSNSLSLSDIGNAGVA
jgi:hypothetical protein